MIRRLVYALMILGAAVLAPPLLAAQVSASVNRHTLHMGETVTLSITVEGASSAARPDLSALSNDFSVLQTSRSSSMKIINGQASSSLTWGVALQPRHTGTLRIPSLTVAGATTQPLTVTVLPPSTAAQGGPGDEVFVAAEIAPDSVYVGQQAVITVRLFYAGQLARGDLEAPSAANADVRKLGDDTHYQAQRGNRPYQVIERRYALIAHQSGDLSLPGIAFKGQMRVSAGRGFGFFNSGRVVHARSGAIQLEVKPKPAKAGDGPWLPARELTLKADGLPANDQAKVGQPLTLTLTETAIGLPFAALPELTLPDIEGAEVYPDQPVTRTGNDGEWLHGKRQRSFAIVPTRPGALHIPAIRVAWWNVRSDQPVAATVPARTLTVSGAAGIAAAPLAAGAARPAPTTSAAMRTAPASITPPAAPPAGPSAHAWRWLAAALLLLWLATIAAWGWRRRRRNALQANASNGAPHATTAQARRAFRQAASSNDAIASSHALLAWARGERPALRNLGELASALDDATQRAAISELERNRYGEQSAALDGTAIAAAFAPGFHWRSAPAGSGRADGLPPLYPFDD